MSMNSSDFPLVWMDLAQGPEHEHQDDFDAFEENLRRGSPSYFSLIRRHRRSMTTRQRRRNAWRCG